MRKREANFQTTFGQYIRAKGIHANFELKQTTGDSIEYDARLNRQCDSLLAAEKEGHYWKYSDQDQREKLFDCSNVPPLKGYIVIKYPKFFCLIRATEFSKEMLNSSRKSLTSQRAKELAEIVVI